MNITQKLVAEVKRSNKRQLHPQSWHDFQALPEVQAVNSAIWCCNEFYSSTDLADIVIEAKKRLNEYFNAL